MSNSLIKGVKSYFTKNPYETIKEVNDKSNFGYDVDYVYVFVVMLLSIIFTVLGFVAVNHICKDTSERGKNTRLGLYAILLLTGGQVGTIYILLWVFNINLCA